MQRSYAVSSCEGAPDWETIPAAQIDEAQWLPNPGVAAWAQVGAPARVQHAVLGPKPGAWPGVL